MPHDTRGPAATRETEIDRMHTLKLVERTGWRKLEFSVKDVRETLEDSPEIRLHRPRWLGYYVKHFEGDRIDWVGQGDLVRGTHPIKGAPNRYVLKERMREYEAGARTLDDPGRTYVALWIAYYILERPVRTADVATVMARIPELLPESGRDASSLLQAIEARSAPLAQGVRLAGHRSKHWRPSGPTPDHPKLDDWLREATLLDIPAPSGSQLGASVRNEMVEALVRRAVKWKSRNWPGGRPIRASEIKRFVQTDEDAKRLYDAIVRSTSFGAALGEASRQSLSGSPRKSVLVERLTDPVLMETYYDIPDERGRDLRRTYILYQSTRQLASKDAFQELREEVRAAASILGESGPVVLQAFGAARLLVVHRRWEDVRTRLAELGGIARSLPTKRREAVEKMCQRLDDFERSAHGLRISGDELRAIVGEVVDPAALDLDDARPLLVAGELVRWIPERSRGGRKPGEFLGSITTLRRFPNPEFEAPHGESPSKRSRVAVDRVSALVHLVVNKYQTQMAPHVDAVGRLLGPDLRCRTLVRALAEEDDPGNAALGAVALAMIGQEAEARSRALHLLNDPLVSYPVALAAVHTLMLTRRLEYDELPSWLQDCYRDEIYELIRKAFMAKNAGEWLMPGRG
jgi:hypothetical protein